MRAEEAVASFGNACRECHPVEWAEDAAATEDIQRGQQCADLRGRQHQRHALRPRRSFAIAEPANLADAGSPWGLPPTAPTDPDVRESRIRLVGSRVDCRTVHRVDHPRRRQGKTPQQPREGFPGKWIATATPHQPLPPEPCDHVAQPLQHREVARDAIVGVVALQLPTQRAMLLRQRAVSILPTPRGDRLDRPAEPAQRRGCGAAGAWMAYFGTGMSHPARSRGSHGGVGRPEVLRRACYDRRPRTGRCRRGMPPGHACTAAGATEK